MTPVVCWSGATVDPSGTKGGLLSPDYPATIAHPLAPVAEPSRRTTTRQIVVHRRVRLKVQRMQRCGYCARWHEGKGKTCARCKHIARRRSRVRGVGISIQGRTIS